MKSIAFLALIACLSIQFVQSAPSDKVDCSKIDEVIDDLGGAQGITTLNDKYKLWTNEDEQAKRCKETDEALKMLKRYNKECFTALTQQVFSAILRSRTQTMDAYCKAGSPEYADALKASKCIVDNAFNPIKDAEQKTVLAAQVLYDSNIPDQKLRMRHSCCGVLASKKLFIDSTKEKCSAYEKVYTDYVDSYTSESMSLICPDSKELQCDKLQPLSLTGATPKYKSFLNPMLKLVKTLDH